MPKRLFMLNTLLAAMALLFAAYIVRELIRPAPSSAPLRARAAAPLAASAAAPATPPAPGSPAIIASRNLFSPTRSEAPTTPGGLTQGPLVAKPNLYGVVLQDGAPIAYLEDPVTKRVAAYRVGDTVAGGRLTKIAADHVILARPEGALDVRLHDPARPRPTVPMGPGQVQPGPPGRPPRAPRGGRAPPPWRGPRREAGRDPGPARPPPRPPTPPPRTAPPVPPGQRGRFVVLNFDNADIETVVHAASEILGFNYVLAPDVRGKVTVQTSGRIPQEEVFGVLLAVLEVHGFTAVKSGSLYKIVRIEGARERAVPLIVGDAADPSRSADEVITQ